METTANANRDAFFTLKIIPRCCLLYLLISSSSFFMIISYKKLKAIQMYVGDYILFSVITAAIMETWHRKLAIHHDRELFVISL
jgi:hypothetical protein